MPGVLTIAVDLQALKDHHPLADVVDASGVRLRGRGRVLQGYASSIRKPSPASRYIRTANASTALAARPRVTSWTFCAV